MINKAFILSKSSFTLPSNWMSCELQNGMILNYEKNLPVASNSRKSVFLIGDAWQIDSEKAKPEEIIQNLNGNESPEVVYLSDCVISMLRKIETKLGQFLNKNISN